MHADVSACADGVDGDIRSLGQLLRQRVCDLLRCAGGNVVFLAVMRLGDVIVKRRQRTGNKAKRREQDIDAEGYVRRKDHAEFVMPCKIGHPEHIRLRITRGAEYDIRAALFTGAQNRSAVCSV